MNSYGLGGKVAVVTGGASGIGRACAHVLARSGADISVWDLDQDAIDVVLQELERFECRTHGAVVDVSDSSAVDAAMDQVIDKLGHVSVVVANAGIGGEQAPSGDYTDEGWHRVISVNLDGVFYTQRAAIRAMKAGGRGGSVINMASILGAVGFASSSAYAAAKHGVVGLTQTAAWEHAADGIRVNAVGPGFIHTPLVEKSLTPEVLQFLESQHALQRLGEAEEVAELLAWLASDGARPRRVPITRSTVVTWPAEVDAICAICAIRTRRNAVIVASRRVSGATGGTGPGPTRTDAPSRVCPGAAVVECEGSGHWRRVMACADGWRTPVTRSWSRTCFFDPSTR
jgi:NAD(P)-dependent dehydrogenase (short-subunit alcohol dehydrogenase family)